MAATAHSGRVLRPAMGAPQTALVDDVTELLILWPHLAGALERDSGQCEGDRVSGSIGFGLPLNADVLQAMTILGAEVPRLTRWASAVVAESSLAAVELDVQLRHIPRLHERMLVTAAVQEAAQLAAGVRALLRYVKLALGLRTHDRLLGHFCPLHDDALCELVAPGDEGVLVYRRLDREGQPIEPAVEWVRSDRALCRHCGSAWAPSQYLLLGRLLRQADARRTAAQTAADGMAEQEGGAA